MFEYQMRTGVRLFKMLKQNKNIRDSLFSLARRIITLIHSEQFNPRTIKFDIIVPPSEKNKVFITLLMGEYMSAPLAEYEPGPQDSSYILTSYIDSLYKALVGENGSMAGFFAICPELCRVIYSIAAYILDTYGCDRDFTHPMRWDCGDHWALSDLIIYGHMPIFYSRPTE